MTTQPYNTGDYVVLIQDGGRFAGAEVVVRAVLPGLPYVYVVHPRHQPNNKADVPHERISHVVSKSPLPNTPRPTPTRVAVSGAGAKEISGLSPLARADYIFSMMSRHGWNQEKAADYFGYKNGSNIAVQKWLTELDEDLKEALRAGEISAVAAKRQQKLRGAGKVMPVIAKVDEAKEAEMPTTEEEEPVVVIVAVEEIPDEVVSTTEMELLLVGLIGAEYVSIFGEEPDAPSSALEMLARIARETEQRGSEIKACHDILNTAMSICKRAMPDNHCNGWAWIASDMEGEIKRLREGKEKAEAQRNTAENEVRGLARENETLKREVERLKARKMEAPIIRPVPEIVPLTPPLTVNITVESGGVVVLGGER